MRCKKHLQDVTSTVGVCASCLRERLQPLLAAQVQAQAQSDGDNSNNNNNNRYKKAKSKPKHEPESETEQNPPPPPINFPSSVSPYATHRKSDRDRRRDRMFYVTPQVTTAACDGGTKRRSGGRFWNISNIFRPRSNKTEFSSRGEEPSSSASPPPPSWFSNILHTRRHGCKQACRRQRANRGLSPTSAAENCCDSSDEAHDRTDSGNSAESSPAKQNPTATAESFHRRSRLGVGGGRGKGLSSMAFCLSPLVRASPSRHWSHKGLAQELGAGGTHHMSSAASFCANRSRKMADFGRTAHNR